MIIKVRRVSASVTACAFGQPKANAFRFGCGDGGSPRHDLGRTNPLSNGVCAVCWPLATRRIGMLREQGDTSLARTEKAIERELK